VGDLRQRAVSDIQGLAPTGLQAIPGTATNWTLDNPGPNPAPLNPWLTDSKPWALRRNPNRGTPPTAGAATPVVAQQPWFSQPFDQSLNNRELPFWMRGMRR